MQQYIEELCRSLGIDVAVAFAGVMAVIMNLLTSDKTKSLSSRLCDAVICGLLSSSLVPVIEYFALPSNFAMFVGVVIGYFGTEYIAQVLKLAIQSLVNKFVNK